MMIAARDKRRRESINRSRHRLGIQAKDLEILEEEYDEEENSASGSGSGSGSSSRDKKPQQQQPQQQEQLQEQNPEQRDLSESANAVVIENMNINRSRHRNVHDLNMSRHSRAPKVYASGHSLSGLSEGSSFISSEEPDVAPLPGNDTNDELELNVLDSYDEVDSDLEVDLDEVDALGVDDEDVDADSADSLSGADDKFDNAIEQMYSHRKSVSSVTNRASLIDSIEWLSRHVPQCVIKQLTHDVLLSMGESGLRHVTPQAPVPASKEPGKIGKGIIGRGKGGKNRVDRRTRKQRRNKSIKRKSLTLIGGRRLSASSKPARRMSRISDGRLSSIDLTQLEPMQMPHGSQYDAALLFIDMSGFTNLAQKLDVDKFSKTINAYFRTIVDEVISRGGDILKFAGDAMFIEWRVGEEYSSKRNKNKDKSNTGKKRGRIMTKEDCVYAAAICGAVVVEKCADYPVYADNTTGGHGQGEQVATLNVHCGLGVGKMGGVHVGNDHSRRLYLVIGNPIDQVSEACDSAQLGEIRASKEALKYLNKGQPTRRKIECENGEVSRVIASRQQIFFSDKKRAFFTMKKRIPKKPNSKFEIPFDEMGTMAIKILRKVLSFYVHPVVVADETAEMEQSAESANGTGDRRSINSLQGRSRRGSSSLRMSRRGSITDGTLAIKRHQSEAELRPVFTIFIKPNIEATLSSDPEKNAETFKLLNDIMYIVASILERYKGHLLQFIRDDKGVVLIGTFGLRGSTFPHMVQERALPTCRFIHSALENELGIDSQIGGTLGKVYCGVVGGVERHEFSVLGASVNLSARLMAQKNHPGILVDNEVQKRARKVNFIKFPPVKAKGYANLVPVFKPLTTKETRWGKVNPMFVGRKKKVDQICKLATDMSRRAQPAKMVFVTGKSGIGKSSFMVHAISKIRKQLKVRRTNLIISRNVSSDGDTLLPFSIFRRIFRDLLGEKRYTDEESTIGSTVGSKSASILSLRGKEYENMSFNAGVKDETNVLHEFEKIAKELNAPKAITRIVGHHLFGGSKFKMSKVEKAPDLDEYISFLTKIFLRSTCQADVTLLALDDVQCLDSLSWRVIQKIFEDSTNVLMVCAGHSMDPTSLTMDESFRKALTQQHKRKKKFFEFPLDVLNNDEVRDMAALKCVCQRSELDDGFIDNIFRQSTGMPHFVSEILDHCIKNDRIGRLPNKKYGLKGNQDKHNMQFANLNELMLERFDSLNELTRKVLQFACVLGSSFDFNEILEISGHILLIPEEEREDHSMEVRRALEEAVIENILDETLQNEDLTGLGEQEDDFLTSLTIKLGNDAEETKTEDTPEYRVYSFHHSSWQRLVLSLLLDSWKRDIHKHVATNIEAREPDPEKRGHRTKLRLFQHWKGSDTTAKAAELGLDIGQGYKMLGLNQHSIKVYVSALEMWKRHALGEDEEAIGGYSPQLLESLDKVNVIYLVKLQTALGQAVGSTLNKDKQESAQAFEDALMVLRHAPASAEIKDRAFIFPIYSGMFFLLKYGVSVVFTENELIANFVNETKKHDDPVHYGRALAMQGETFHRQGKYEEAIESHMELKRVYDVERHHALVVSSYASDRVGQNFGCTANCYMRLNQLDKAMDVVDHITTSLIPKMDPKNVHNSIVTIYPAIWILKDNGRVERAREIFLKYVMEPFKEYFGEDGSTPFLPAFRGIEMLLNLASYMEGKVDSFDKEYFDWALDINNLEMKAGFDSSIGNFGRNSSSTSAEICLRLLKLTEDEELIDKLASNGLKVAKQAISRCDGTDGPKLMTTYLQIKPVYDELILVNPQYENEDED